MHLRHWLEVPNDDFLRVFLRDIQDMATDPVIARDPWPASDADEWALAIDYCLTPAFAPESNPYLGRTHRAELSLAITSLFIHSVDATMRLKEQGKIATDEDTRITIEALIGNSLYHFIGDFSECQSPLERAFYVGYAIYNYDNMLGIARRRDEWQIRCQVPLGKYHLDFAVERDGVGSIAVELDGHSYHERTREQAVHDRERDRYVQAEGWTILRYHADEVKTDLEGCVRSLLDQMAKLEAAKASRHS